MLMMVVFSLRLCGASEFDQQHPISTPPNVSCHHQRQCRDVWDWPKGACLRKGMLCCSLLSKQLVLAYAASGGLAVVAAAPHMATVRTREPWPAIKPMVMSWRTFDALAADAVQHVCYSFHTAASHPMQGLRSLAYWHFYICRCC